MLHHSFVTGQAARQIDQYVDPPVLTQHVLVLDALDEWTNLQVEAYPQQSEKIQWVSAAMLDFLHSPLVERRKMLLGRRYGSA